MKKYNVTITETLQKTVTVKAKNAEKAEDIARENYDNEVDGFVLTADDHRDTYFKVCEVEMISNKFALKDRIAVASVAKKIFDAEHLNLEVKNGAFVIKDTETEDYYKYPRFTLMQVVDGIDTFLGDSFLSGKCVDNWERMIHIILKSDLVADILNTIDVDFYNQHFNEINNVDFNNEYYDEKYLINKTIAHKVIETQSAYLMTEYEDKIYISNYAIYDDCENGMQSFMADIIEYNNDRIIDPPFSIFDNYADVIKSELQQIKDDYNDLGKNDFYLSFEELTYIGTLED